MSGLCSAHKHYHTTCKVCNVDVHDVFPDYDEKLKEAIASGVHTCINCKFEFYKTTSSCPKCGTNRRHPDIKTYWQDYPLGAGLCEQYTCGQAAFYYSANDTYECYIVDSDGKKRASIKEFDEAIRWIVRNA